MKTFKVGQSVWYRNVPHGCISKATIMDIKNTTDDILVKISSPFGTTVASANDLYSTKRECIEAQHKKFRHKVDQYKFEIQTVNDLILFPLREMVSNVEEYSNPAARRAYEERAIELGYIEEKSREIEKP